MRKLLLPVGALVLTLTACSEAPKQAAKKEAERPPEPVNGLTALFRMYQMTRSWAPDAQVLKVMSQTLTEVPNVPRGKAALWEATFVSPSRNQSRSYTYAIIEVQPTVHKGAFAGPEQAWTGPRGNTTPFLMAAVKTDTDAAYETALKNGGEEYDKKFPGKPISILLEKVSKHPNPVWRVIWGESLGTSNFSVYVDASTGAFMEKLH